VVWLLIEAIMLQAFDNSNRREDTLRHKKEESGLFILYVSIVLGLPLVLTVQSCVDQKGTLE
jgi:hypothetical protein